MRIRVNVEALAEDGGVVLGYFHEELIVPTSAEVDGAEVIRRMAAGKGPTPEMAEAMDVADAKTAGATLDALMERLDEARASMVDQAAASILKERPDEPPGP